jgi:ribonuclease BN (tRNA processing enzyme)
MVPGTEPLNGESWNDGPSLSQAPVENLRIHFYGVQGSGSVFPARSDRQAVRQLLEQRLLEQVFLDLAQMADPATGKIGLTVEQILGGPLCAETLDSYRRKFLIPEPRAYGGWTTCIWIETADGDDLVFDCGSGFRNCAKDLQKKWADRRERTLYLFGTHSHLDHTEGFDQAAVCFDPRNTIRVFGNRQFLHSLDASLGVFSRAAEGELRGVQTPLNFSLMPARFQACEIRDLETSPAPEGDTLAQAYHHLREPLRLGRTRIWAFPVYHPAPCLAYRIEREGKSFLFCTDHELRRGNDHADPRQIASLRAEAHLREEAAGIDLLYRDGQFLRDEYDGKVGVGSSGPARRLDWGHSCIEDVREMARECGVKLTLVGHHDPNRDWLGRSRIDEWLHQHSEPGCRLELACAETTFRL